MFNRFVSIILLIIIAAFVPLPANAAPQWASRAYGASSIAAPAMYAPAQQPAVKISVEQAGMQQISGTGLPAFALSQLRLFRGATEIALEIDDADGDARLSAADALRFYAPSPGDRWNRADTYWLTTVGNGQPLRIARRALAAGGGVARTSAVETGTWRMPVRYESQRAGPSGDHWFSGQLTASPDFAPTAGMTATINTVLPRSSGTASYSVAGSAFVSGSQGVQVQAGAASALFRLNGNGDWRVTVRLAAESQHVVLQLEPGFSINTVLPDAIDWQIPVALQFGSAQAAFVAPTSEPYALAGVAADALVYALAASGAERLMLADHSRLQAEAGQRYLVVPAGALHTPQVEVFTPPDLSAALAAQVLYVAPAAWHAALAPLVALRQEQGYRVALLDPQVIYDTWSAGQVAPEAIRSLFRAAYAGNGALVAATLVGDGTNDPFGYSRKPGPETANNLNIIPPYLAPVDPTLLETACDTCFGLLDGDSPLDDVLPEIMIGRIPAKTVEQLGAVVAKIVTYERMPLDREAASRSFFVADNYQNVNEDGSVVSDISDFAADAEQAIALQPANVQIGRMFYDPTAAASASREPNAERAYQRTRAMLDSGAALITYVGHGGVNQWATTDTHSDPGVLLNLYDPDRMQNGTRTPIILEMTCLTSAFQVPNFYSTAIDERLLLKANGGAVATWGSSGAGVSLGHDALMRGFYTALWAAPGQPKTLGALTQHGYANLAATAPEDITSIRTFLILGDPLTTVRVAPAYRTYLPLAE